MKPANFTPHSVRLSERRHPCRPAGSPRSEKPAGRLRLALYFSILTIVAIRLSAAGPEPVDPATFVGNVYGVVTDATSGTPVSGASVILVEPTDEGCRRSHRHQVHDCIEKAPFRGRNATTGSDGSFLINFVPAPADGLDYTLRITHSSHRHAAMEVHVLPGATMALEVSASLRREDESSGRDSEISVHYRHEAVDPPETDSGAPEGTVSSRAIHAEVFRGSIFATREGLVGGTTANGHIIVPNDRFVALPSRRALSSNFGHEREVRLTYRGRTTVAPVWDVGPWNTHDDYWNPPNIRETFKDLPMGKPESETAFYDHYNGGLDERGRVVKNPAGIDLADGTFQLDLALTNNDRVNVEYLWVDSAGPLIGSISVSPDPAAAGGNVVIEATASDVSTGNAPIAGAEFFFDSSGDTGTGVPASPADGAFDSPVETIRASVPVVLNSGQRHTVFLRARDVYSNWGPLVATTFAVVAPGRQRAVSH